MVEEVGKAGHRGGDGRLLASDPQVEQIDHEAVDTTRRLTYKGNHLLVGRRPSLLLLLFHF